MANFQGVRTQTTVSLSEAIDWHITLTQLKDWQRHLFRGAQWAQLPKLAA